MISGDELLQLSRSGAPLTTQREAWREALRQRGVGETALSSVMRHVRDGVVLSSALTPGRTRLGGPGALPEGEPWPHLPGDAADWHLGFLMEIALDELVTVPPLPADGTLLIFQDQEMFGLGRDAMEATRVFYVPPGVELTHPEAPEKLLWPLPAKHLGSRAAPIPGDASLTVRELPEGDRESVIAAMNEVGPAAMEDCGHWLLGAPVEVQGPVLEELTRTFADLSDASRQRLSPTLLRGEGWRLLAQVGAEYDREIGLSFEIADGGALFLCIPDEDLHALRFDRVIGFAQSH